MKFFNSLICCLLLMGCGQKPAENDGVVSDSSTAETIPDDTRSWNQREAVFVKDGWIRDPYIYLADDDYYYLTGTTMAPADPREESDPLNAGLDKAANKPDNKPSGVGPYIRVWKSKTLTDWTYVGEPFRLDQGYWATAQPEAFEDMPMDQWKLWAPELYQVSGKWAFVHTTPTPVKQGANLLLTTGDKMEGPFTTPLGEKMKGKHDPALFQDDDGTWYLLWGNTNIVALKDDFTDFAARPQRIDPADRVIGHEGATLRKIGDKYVHFGTAWSTDQMRKGSYNLYYCTSDNITGPYGPRRFAGRFLGHGTPFQDREGNWWCTAFYNANVPPVPSAGIQTRDLGENAQTINPQGTTLVPLEVQIEEDGDVFIRAIDPRYRNPGPDEVQHFNQVSEY